MTSRRPGSDGLRARVVAALLVVWAVAWSPSAGRIVEDTKNDLYVDPWGFLSRALHLWDPQVTWGVLQNQGYGYLFPMGPFFGVLSEVVPVWVAQRLWWTTLLTAGLLGAVGLLRALGVRSPSAVVVAALATTLSPRVLSTIGGLSAEAHPVLLAPLVLLPLVLASNGRCGPRRAAALSAVAILACGGVNATATAFAAAPAVVWLLTRPRWWASPLTWWWSGLALASVSWWLGPLLLLGRWSPPFLDWIERSADVVREIDVLDVVRGTSHWLAFVVTGAGEWWPAAHELATSPLLVVATSTVAAVSVAGLALGGLPERRFVLTSLAVGLVVLVVPLSGLVASPVSEVARTLLDGDLAPLRNIHKADPLVRIPLGVGLAVALARIGSAVQRSRTRVRAGTWLAVSIVGLAVVAPGVSGAVAPRGSFTATAEPWEDAGAYLSARADQGRALVVPASSFGEYTWGRTIDEPIRPLTVADYAVRDAVPLTPAGTIRFLDAVEQRLQTGRSLGGAVEVLRRTGVGFLVVRNDLDTVAAGQPPVAVARSSVRTSPGVTFERGFGPTRLDLGGDRVQPVEIYRLGEPSPLLSTQDVDDVVAVRGGAEDLPSVADAGLGGLAVLEDDLVPGVEPGRRVLTDGYRARQRWFGATRGRDVSSTLTRAGLDGSRDYRPWPDTGRHAVVVLDGVRSVTASSSVATDLTLAGVRPAGRPAAALDGDPTTAWLTSLDERPRLDVDLGTPREVRTARIRVASDRERWSGLGVPTRLAVGSDAGDLAVDVPSGGVVDVALPAGPTRHLVVSVLDTDRGAPGQVLTGLTEVTVDGVTAREVVTAPPSGADRTDAVLLDRGTPLVDGCVRPEDVVVCLSDAVRDAEGGASLSARVDGPGGVALTATGTMTASPWADRLPGTDPGGATIATSSARSRSAAARPEALLDGDAATAWSPSPTDPEPAVTIRPSRTVDVAGIVLDGRRDWFARHRPVVRVVLDGREVVVRATATGFLDVRGTVRRQLDISFVPGVGRSRGATASLELAEILVGGLDVRPPPSRIVEPCGAGPALTVDGVDVPTRLDGPRSALWGDGELRWTACRTVRLGVSGPHEVTLVGDDVLRPDTVRLVAAAAARTVQPRPVPARRLSPTRISGQLEAGAQRVLAVAGNHNDGWTATLDGRALFPLVVDGFRQGFVVPAGASGVLDVRFAPDRPYRGALLAGVVLAVGVLAAALSPDRRRLRPVAERSSPTDRWRIAGSGVLGGFAVLLVLGGWALLAATLAAVLAVVVRRRATRPDVALAVLAAAAIGAAGVTAAVTSPERGTVPWVGATAALLVTAAAVWCVAGSVAPPSASPGARRRRGWPRRAPH